jgi:uncharacterized protein
MICNTFTRFLCLLPLLAALGACGESGEPGNRGDSVDLTHAQDPVRELAWDDLMPVDYDPAKVLPDDIDISEMSDSDPRAERYMQMVRELWNQAPVVPELDGQIVKIPGFVVPVDYDDKQVSQFLLVPYFGACIHVPPPPSNQIVHVATGGYGPSPAQLWDPVWVTGTLRTEHIASELGEAGYRMEAMAIEPYGVEQGVTN